MACNLPAVVLAVLKRNADQLHLLKQEHITNKEVGKLMVNLPYSSKGYHIIQSCISVRNKGTSVAAAAAA